MNDVALTSSEPDSKPDKSLELEQPLQTVISCTTEAFRIVYSIQARFEQNWFCHGKYIFDNFSGEYTTPR